MLILDTVNKSIEIVLGAAVAATQLPVFATYADHTSSAFTPISSDTQSNSTTAVTIVAAPAASTQRQVKSVSIFNADTASATVTVRLNNSATLRTIIKAALAVGEGLHYDDANGWFVLDVAGRRKVTPSETSGSNGRAYTIFKPGTAPDTTGYWYCFAKDAGFPGAWAPGTPGMAGRATDGTAAADAGCVPIQNPSTGSNYLSQFNITGTVAGWFLLFDCLWVQSGIVVTTTTAQTINSVAFPARDINGTVNGEGCMIGLLTTTANTNAAVINNSIVTYTNSDGTASRTATLANLVGAQIPVSPAIGTIVWFGLAAGDKGVQSIQSITLNTSLAAGAVSLLVARPLASLPVSLANAGAQFGFALNPGVRLYNNTCALLALQASSTTAVTASGLVYVMER